MMKEAIEVDDLVVRRRGRVVLDGLRFTVGTGRVVGLLGPSGSGKSTLLRAVVGVQRVESGRVTVLGRPAGSASLRQEVAYTTQSPSVYGDLTVQENLEYVAALVGAPGGAVDTALARVDLVGHRLALAARLSGGQRTRVALAAALLGRPRLLVLDEPTVGLDPVLRASLWALFHALAADGATLLVSSHVMDEARRCDRLLLLRDGRLLADDTADGLRARTGRDDLDDAFLALVAEAETAGAAR